MMVVQVLYSQLVGVDQVAVAGIEYDIVAANNIEWRSQRVLIGLLSRKEGPLPNHISFACFLCNVEA